MRLEAFARQLVDVPPVTARAADPDARLIALLRTNRRLTPSEWAELTAFEERADG